MPDPSERGRGEDFQRFLLHPSRVQDFIPSEGEMVNGKEYQAFVGKVQKKFKRPTDALVVWGLGLSGESGDAAGCIKKTLFHDNDQTQGIKENLGDCLWYIAAICNYFGWGIEDLMKENVDKLKSRYPEGHFSEKKARRNGKRKDWNETGK